MATIEIDDDMVDTLIDALFTAAAVLDSGNHNSDQRDAQLLRDLAWKLS